jgi:aminoglycoside phosphotransferase family enzyme/predicted kinase
MSRKRTETNGPHSTRSENLGDEARPNSPAQAVDPAEILRLLEAGDAPNENAAPVVIRETHASQVFLTPSDVFKLKKAVDLGFLNYSTLRRRAHMCKQEVLLNRRLAPEVYLGVEKLTRERNGSLTLNGHGSVVDYLVHMKRLPDECSLAGRLGAAMVGHAEVERDGARIGTFHRTAPPADPAFGPRTFLANAEENLRQLQSTISGSYLGGAVQELTDYFADARTQLRPALDARAAAGWIRDGHGDLRAEHIYLLEGIVIIDCVEFNARYRRSDTALDFAFLAMDLHTLGYPDLVAPLVQSYEAEAQDVVDIVLPTYCWYRALVRAKVAGVLAGEEHVAQATRSAAGLDVRRYVHHGLGFARGNQRPLLIVVGGLPGTGKTTLARGLADAVGAQVRCADEVRKRLAGLGPGVHIDSALDSGLYGSDMNERVYRSLLEFAKTALNLGRSIVLDATFRRPANREAVHSLAVRSGARFLMVECEAPNEVVEKRLRGREINPDDWSDATVETYRALRKNHSRSAGLSQPELMPLSTDRPLLELVDDLLSVMR